MPSSAETMALSHQDASAAYSNICPLQTAGICIGTMTGAPVTIRCQQGNASRMFSLHLKALNNDSILHCRLSETLSVVIYRRQENIQENL